MGTGTTATGDEAQGDVSKVNQREDAEELVMVDEVSPLGPSGSSDASLVSAAAISNAAANAVSSAAASLGTCCLSPDPDDSAVCASVVHDSATRESSGLRTPHVVGALNDKEGVQQSLPDASISPSSLSGMALAEGVAERQRRVAELTTSDMGKEVSVEGAAQVGASHNGVTHASRNGVTAHALSNGRQRHQEQPRGRSHERKPLG